MRQESHRNSPINVVIEQAAITGWKGASKHIMLADTPLRRELLSVHPLHTGQAAIVTPMVREMYHAFKTAVLLGERGAYFSGTSGEGRSMALRICMRLLADEYPDIVAYYHRSTLLPTTRPTTILQAMLSSVCHALLSGGVVALRERLVVRVLEDLRHRGLAHSVVWCVDNAENLQLQELVILKDLQERLREFDVQLIPIPMAEAQLAYDAQTTRYCTSILEHFFRQEYRLRGPSGLDDIAQILDAVDTLEFPDESGVSWTEFFVPKAYASGFRLQQETVALFDALSRSKMRERLGHPTTGALFTAIRWALLRGAGHDQENLQISAEDWRKAFEYAFVHQVYIPPRLEEVAG